MSAIIGPRNEGWLVDWLNGSDVVGLPLVKGSGSHDWHLDRAIPLGMSCLLSDRLADESPLPDLREGWIRVTHIINNEPYTIGTFIHLPAPRHLSRTSQTVTLSAADPTRLLDRAGLRSRVTYPAGTPVAETVRELVATYAPAVSAVIDDTDETLREHLTYDAGSPVLMVCNKLLEAAAYAPLAPRTDGTLWSSRWVPVAERPVALTFAAGMAPHVPEADIEEEERPSEVIARTRGGQDAVPILGRWPDYPPPNPITKVIDVDATSVPAATLLARRAYDEAQTATAWTTVTGPWQPVAPGEVARFTRPRHGVDLRAELVQLRTRWIVTAPTAYSLSGGSRG